jgi:hypothetical protein
MFCLEPVLDQSAVDFLGHKSAIIVQQSDRGPQTATPQLQESIDDRLRIVLLQLMTGEVHPETKIPEKQP